MPPVPLRLQFFVHEIAHRLANGATATPCLVVRRQYRSGMAVTKRSDTLDDAVAGRVARVAGNDAEPVAITLGLVGHPSATIEHPNANPTGAELEAKARSARDQAARLLGI